MDSQIVTSLAPYVLLEVAAAATGYSVKAIRRKIEEGVWQEGREWRKAPDGHVLISVEGYRKWVENKGTPPKPKKPGGRARTGVASTTFQASAVSGAGTTTGGADAPSHAS